MRYNILNGNISGNPFTLSNDYVEYFYYPSAEASSNTSQLPFSIIKENQTLVTAILNTASSTGQLVSVETQVPKLTISTWSGLAMQCLLITNNMACTLLLPKKYNGQVQGLAYGNITGDANEQCIKRM